MLSTVQDYLLPTVCEPVTFGYEINIHTIPSREAYYVGLYYSKAKDLYLHKIKKQLNAEVEIHFVAHV